jgi:cation:H+ antiporter
MNELVSLFLITLGVVLLYFGGEWLVRSSVSLARNWRVSAMVVGLTVVAFGTSSPEMAASLAAALMDSPEIAIGNVVGSNIFNIMVILGLTALMAPFLVKSEFIKREVPLMIGVALLLFPILYFGNDLNRLEGLIMLALLVLYVWFLYRLSPGDPAEVQSEYEQEYGDVRKTTPSWQAYLGVLLGLVLLVLGARLLVEGSVDLARGLGVSELVIGLTIVAAGTSLPELATSIVAAIRRQPDIALGNIVGSNIFNILGILGVTALVQPIGLPWETIQRDMWVMLGISLLLWFFIARGARLGRKRGAALLALYLAYVALLILTGA